MAPPAKQARQLYVLEGFDHNGAFKGADDIYSKDPSVIIIHAKPGESLEHAVKQIKGPANIILNAHGGEDGTFAWNKDQSIPYAQLMKALPNEGIESVTLNSCYGGTVQRDDIIAATPVGTIVQSAVGPDNVGDGAFITRVAQAAHQSKSSTSIFIEALAAFDAKEYVRDTTEWNKDGKYGKLDTNPEHALPHMLGIGGNPPTLINLDQQVSEIVNGEAPTYRAMGDSRGQGFDKAAWDRSVKETHDVFEHSALHGGVKSHSSDHKMIDKVAEEMRAGKAPQGVEEKRIAYALTTAYMEQSGELAFAQKQARDELDPPWALSPEERAKKEKLQEQKDPLPQKDGLPDLSSLRQKVFENHKLVTEKHQSTDETKALENFAKVMNIQGVRTDGAQLSDAEIRKIQEALHVKQDGKVGEKTLGAMMHAEEVHALPTPKDISPTRNTPQR